MSVVQENAKFMYMRRKRAHAAALGKMYTETGMEETVSGVAATGERRQQRNEWLRQAPDSGLQTRFGLGSSLKLQRLSVLAGAGWGQKVSSLATLRLKWDEMAGNGNKRGLAPEIWTRIGYRSLLAGQRQPQPSAPPKKDQASESTKFEPLNHTKRAATFEPHFHTACDSRRLLVCRIGAQICSFNIDIQTFDPSVSDRFFAVVEIFCLFRSRGRNGVRLRALPHTYVMPCRESSFEFLAAPGQPQIW
ncbi:hypothetical protein F5144DRAFT_297186 [Chaetomium tenue]|uniref:Uncharacterized protein n=1 Tax=Chaetomium tenue TaxID=1854479 RepID=A0ACB7P2Q8_9PEZI|nr:hypothetical protein F5144DRAFT_297186 [Chaetomium globosum]